MLTAIRCPNDRPHNKYSLCGKLLGAVSNGSLFVFCEECKEFFEISLKENDNIEMSPVSKENRLRLKTGLRVIIHDR